MPTNTSTIEAFFAGSKSVQKLYAGGAEVWSGGGGGGGIATASHLWLESNEAADVIPDTGTVGGVPLTVTARNAGKVRKAKGNSPLAFGAGEFTWIVASDVHASYTYHGIYSTVATSIEFYYSGVREGGFAHVRDGVTNYYRNFENDSVVAGTWIAMTRRNGANALLTVYGKGGEDSTATDPVPVSAAFLTFDDLTSGVPFLDLGTLGSPGLLGSAMWIGQALTREQIEAAVVEMGGTL